MFAVYRTLSLRYLVRRWFRAVLIVASIALGVATLVATRALNETMTRAGYHATNPLAGAADLLVSNSNTPIEGALAEKLEKIPGVRAAYPRIFEKVQLPDLGNRSALLVGIRLQAEAQDAGNQLWEVKINEAAVVRALWSGLPMVVVGQGLDQQIPAELFRQRTLPLMLPAGQFMGSITLREKTSGLQLRPASSTHIFEVARIGTVDAKGPAAALAGNVLIMELSVAAKLLGLKQGQVHRIDLALQPEADRDQVKAAVEKVVAGHAAVRTPEEQNQMVQNVLSGMQTGFGLCGIAALVVGMFLVYNSLSVSVAERRHEIGILLSLGGTRGQVQRLFAGEAAMLGLAGGLLGLPLGLGLAYLGRGPAQEVLRNIFYAVEADDIEVSTTVLVLALLAGIATAVVAALLPAVRASHENPAEAVRRIPPKPSWRYRTLQITASLTLMVLGLVCILLRGVLPWKFGIYGGLVLVLLGALLATPLLAALAAWLLQPLSRQFFGIGGRLAADNLVRAPTRTGLVIAALAAGVSLVMMTAGVIRSNRQALRDWVQESIGADLIVTSGSPVGAAGTTRTMDSSLAGELEQVAGVCRALPLRATRHTLGTRQVMLIAICAGDMARLNGPHRPHSPMYELLSRHPDSVLVSENFRALHGLHPGSYLTLSSPNGPIRLRVLGSVVDYSWNHGTIIMDRQTYLRYWEDDRVDVFDVYLRPANPQLPSPQREPGELPDERLRQVQDRILRQLGAANALVIQTRPELQAHIDSMIEQLYGIAYSQLIVVMLVAALGVVTALLISVLQRRREMGLLRAIGASQTQVVRSVLAEAALMGQIGTVIGLIVGIPLEWYVLQILILEETGYFFPLYIPWTEGLVIALAAVTLATLAGLGPALYAVRQRIPEAIAYE